MAEIHKITEVYNESLENDPVFQEIQEKEQKFKEEHKEQKQKVKMNESLKAMEDELKKLKTEIKENKEILSLELAEYYKDSGSLEIEDAEGNVKRIVFAAKLVNQ